MAEQPTLDDLLVEQAREQRARTLVEARCPRCKVAATVLVEALTDGRWCTRGCGFAPFEQIDPEGPQC